MRFSRMKHIGAGRFQERLMPRCKCTEPDGNRGGLCKRCKLAVLTDREDRDYARAYPATARMLAEEKAQNTANMKGTA